MLDNIAKEMSRGQNDLKELQFNIKKCPHENIPALNDQFNTIRQLLNELDLQFSQKKKSLKFDL